MEENVPFSLEAPEPVLRRASELSMGSQGPQKKEPVRNPKDIEDAKRQSIILKPDSSLEGVTVYDEEKVQAAFAQFEAEASRSQGAFGMDRKRQNPLFDADAIAAVFEGEEDAGAGEVLR